MDKIIIGNDHAGVNLKFEIKKYLESINFDVINVGVDTNDSFDYPKISLEVCNKLKKENAKFGIIICGSGVGVSIAANKIKGIRAACVSDSLSSRLSRLHNNANVICFGERIVGIETAKEIVREFVNTNFLGDRHKKRVDQISQIENLGEINE